MPDGDCVADPEPEAAAVAVLVLPPVEDAPVAVAVPDMEPEDMAEVELSEEFSVDVDTLVSYIKGLARE